MNATSQETSAEWTIMIYIAADNELANFAIESLKQLKQAAGNKVIVAAQLDVDGPFTRERIRRYIFDNRISPDASIDQYIVKTLDPGTNMVDPETLTAFVEDIYDDPKCKANHRCLVLWGHGPELLTESAPADVQVPSKTDGSTKLYLTPSELAQALKDAHLGNGRKLDIVALDTCSSSLSEIAAELHSYADFMIASQEDVPDMSFPYDRLLQFFRKDNSNVQEICETAVNEYLKNYQDYIFGANTGTSKVSLSALKLANFTTTIAAPIKELAAALLEATKYDKLSRLVLQARNQSHGFVAGLFVDIVDFCKKMLAQLGPDRTKDGKLEAACAKVINSFPKKNLACVIANAAVQRTQCHGLSIYFPFLTSEDAQAMNVSFVKGGDVLTKGGDILTKGGDVLTKGGDILTKGGDVLTKLRRQRITELEADYPTSALSRETDWYGFIRDGWSRLLAEQLPEELDVRYSAQQCAVNLLNGIINRKPTAPNDNDHPRGPGDNPDPPYEPKSQVINGDARGQNL